MSTAAAAATWKIGAFVDSWSAFFWKGFKHNRKDMFRSSNWYLSFSSVCFTSSSLTACLHPFKQLTTSKDVISSVTWHMVNILLNISPYSPRSVNMDFFFKSHFYSSFLYLSQWPGSEPRGSYFLEQIDTKLCCFLFQFSTKYSVTVWSLITRQTRKSCLRNHMEQAELEFISQVIYSAHKIYNDRLVRNLRGHCCWI